MSKRKFTDNQEIEIGKLYGIKKKTQEELALLYGCSESTIRNILKRTSTKPRTTRESKYHYQHVEQVEKNEKLKVLGLYINSQEFVRYFCLRHYEVGLSRPYDAENGRGLKCCRLHAQYATQQKKKAKAASEYDKKIAEYGILKRVGTYVDSKSPIEHFCLIHKKPGLCTPSLALIGRGMKCCRLAASQEQADRRKAKAAKEFLEKLAEKNKKVIYVSGEYKGSTVKSIIFKCLKHGFEDNPQPTDVLRGQSLKCCKQEASYANIAGDKVWKALTGKLERQGFVFLYLYKTKNPNFNKYGLTNNLKKRATSGKYGESLIDPFRFNDRADGVLIEQAFKYSYGIDTPPLEFKNWAGKTELTNFSSEEFKERIQEFISELLRLKRWDFAKEYCDPIEVDLAINYLRIQNQ